MPNYKQRRDKLRRLVRETNADAILVTSYDNVTYLTGFTGDSSYLLLTRDGQIILSDKRYTTQLENECPNIDLDIRGPESTMLECVAKLVRKTKLGSLAIEAGNVTLEFFQKLEEKLAKVDLVATGGLVEQLREIKDKDELTEIREAIGIAERAFAVVKAGLRPEQTEKQVCDEIERQVRLFGGACTAFWPIVGVGPNGALPHYRPGEVKVEESFMVLVDWGAKAKLYMSDLTRIIVTGKAPAKLERVYNIVLKAQKKAIEAIRPGAIMEDIDAAARKVITDAGFGKQFGHSLGHGFGLQIHEQPRLAVNQKRPLQTGMVVTVEPGIYLPGAFGVRIEDDILVTSDGHEVLSNVPKEYADCVI
ncbi:MAG: aminopeptidase P family protein [Planctomycetaceae bacterium]|nr:aminopeptidase P family protein [Planctomycetales bacterium]MCB9922659.1 aminopeptidase P family protein [Planctomycetaceae bacterium]